MTKLVLALALGGHAAALLYLVVFALNLYEENEELRNRLEAQKWEHTGSTVYRVHEVQEDNDEEEDL